MEHYISNKAKNPKTRSERISDTVEISHKISSIPKMSSTDATIHAAQDLFDALQNQAPARPLATRVNAHKEALISLAYIFVKQPTHQYCTMLVL